MKSAMKMLAVSRLILRGVRPSRAQSVLRSLESREDKHSLLPADPREPRASPGNEICYKGIGCFPADPPWCATLQRPICAQPWSPERINTQYFLLTRENPERHQVISARDRPGLQASSFRTSRDTTFIVHGMADRAEKNWVPDMCREILSGKDVNCIGVDWRNGSGNPMQYVQAVNNVRVVGAEIAEFLKQLQEDLNYSPSNIHIIGHSLGAHTAGEAGRRSPGIRRITALDPASPYFENADEKVRLDASDADFVDVIHTDMEHLTGLGIAHPVGHYDYYPNGGKNMVGCPHKLLSILQNDFLKTFGCNHLRAIDYYMHSIRNADGFVSYPCDSYENFLHGSCFPCRLQRCPPMGHHAEEYYTPGERRTFYLNTGADLRKLSSWRYKISLNILGKAELLDKIYISITGAGGNTIKEQLGSGGYKFIDSPVRLQPLDQVTSYWIPPLFINLLQKQLGVSRVDLEYVEDGSISSFCGNGMVLDNVVQVLVPCAAEGEP